MAGTWPYLDISDIETRVRFYLNEASAKFYTQAEIWKWIAAAARDISQKTLCVRRILSSATTANVRNINTNVYKVLYVEYVPSSGRNIILPKIDPLKVNHYPLIPSATYPQYWYEFGNAIGIEPLPDAAYNLKIYVSDLAKIVSEPVWTTAWTTGANWLLGDDAIHSSTSSDLTYTAGITSGVNYTFEFKVTGIGASSTLKLTCGTIEGVTITLNGHHTQSFVSNGTTLKLTAVGAVTVDNFKIYKQANISSETELLELKPEWLTTLSLYATCQGLLKDKKIEQSVFLMSTYQNEFDYLIQNVIEVIPDSKDSVTFL